MLCRCCPASSDHPAARASPAVPARTNTAAVRAPLPGAGFILPPNKGLQYQPAMRHAFPRMTAAIEDKRAR
jgi:hypothetical protein